MTRSNLTRGCGLAIIAAGLVTLAGFVFRCGPRKAKAKKTRNTGSSPSPASPDVFVAPSVAFAMEHEVSSETSVENVNPADDNRALSTYVVTPAAPVPEAPLPQVTFMYAFNPSTTSSSTKNAAWLLIQQMAVLLVTLGGAGVASCASAADILAAIYLLDAAASMLPSVSGFEGILLRQLTASLGARLAVLASFGSAGSADSSLALVPAKASMPRSKVLKMMRQLALALSPASSSSGPVTALRWSEDADGSTPAATSGDAALASGAATAPGAAMAPGGSPPPSPPLSPAIAALASTPPMLATTDAEREWMVDFCREIGECQDWESSELAALYWRTAKAAAVAQGPSIFYYLKRQVEAPVEERGYLFEFMEECLDSVKDVLDVLKAGTVSLADAMRLGWAANHCWRSSEQLLAVARTDAALFSFAAEKAAFAGDYMPAYGGVTIIEHVAVLSVGLSWSQALKVAQAIAVEKGLPYLPLSQIVVGDPTPMALYYPQLHNGGVLMGFLPIPAAAPAPAAAAVAPAQPPQAFTWGNFLKPGTTFRVVQAADVAEDFPPIAAHRAEAPAAEAPPADGSFWGQFLGPGATWRVLKV